MIVRWGLAEAGPLLSELGSERPLLVTSERLAGLDVPVAARFTGARRHSPLETVSAATAAAERADVLVGAGGGSAIDTAKAVSAATGLRLVAIPTTYAGAEWTPRFGMRDEARRLKTGGSGANTVGIVYDPALTLDLPRDETFLRLSMLISEKPAIRIMAVLLLACGLLSGCAKIGRAHV